MHRMAKYSTQHFCTCIVFDTRFFFYAFTSTQFFVLLFSSGKNVGQLNIDRTDKCLRKNVQDFHFDFLFFLLVDR